MKRIALYIAVVCTLSAQAGFRTEGRLVLVNASVFDDRNRFRAELRRGICGFIGGIPIRQLCIDWRL